MGIKEQRMIPVKNRIHRRESERISVKQGNVPVRKQTLDIQESGNRETRFRRWIANIQNRNASIVTDRKRHCDKQSLTTLPGMSGFRAMAEEEITEQMEGGEELREAVQPEIGIQAPRDRKLDLLGGVVIVHFCIKIDHRPVVFRIFGEGIKQINHRILLFQRDFERFIQIGRASCRERV